MSANIKNNTNTGNDISLPFPSCGLRPYYQKNKKDRCKKEHFSRIWSELFRLESLLYKEGVSVMNIITIIHPRISANKKPIGYSELTQEMKKTCKELEERLKSSTRSKIKQRRVVLFVNTWNYAMKKITLPYLSKKGIDIQPIDIMFDWTGVFRVRVLRQDV